ncbi:MAG: hypothetical protein ABFC71_04195 [Methanoregula sp.]
MPDYKEIPDSTKWRLASRCASMIPALYDRVFRAEVGERYDVLEQEIWMELARMVPDIARDLVLPTHNAHDLAMTMQTVTVILFGPEYRGEVLDVADDRSVILVKRCPFLEHGCHAGIPGEQFFSRCMTLTLTAVPLLNKNYSARYVRTICTRDRQCEIKIQPNPPETKEK